MSCMIEIISGQKASARMTGIRNLTWMVSVLGTMVACGATLAQAPIAPAQRYPRYLLRTSDILSITFPLTPEFDQTVTVQPDGYVSLRGIGDMHVQGKSVPEVRESFRAAYGKFLHEPIINVELKEFEKPYFIAVGEFAHPGKFELRGDTTVAEAVGIAGGYTDRAKHSQILLCRRVPEGWLEAQRLDIKGMLSKRDLREDLHLRPGDLIFVPQNRISKVRQFIPNAGFTVPGLH
jgi:polysaccharide export outer membrane protein